MVEKRGCLTPFRRSGRSGSRRKNFSTKPLTPAGHVREKGVGSGAFLNAPSRQVQTKNEKRIRGTLGRAGLSTSLGDGAKNS